MVFQKCLPAKWIFGKLFRNSQNLGLILSKITSHQSIIRFQEKQATVLNLTAYFIARLQLCSRKTVEKCEKNEGSDIPILFVLRLEVKRSMEYLSIYSSIMLENL